MVRLALQVNHSLCVLEIVEVIVLDRVVVAEAVLGHQYSVRLTLNLFWDVALARLVVGVVDDDLRGHPGCIVNVFFVLSGHTIVLRVVGFWEEQLLVLHLCDLQLRGGIFVPRL